MPFRSVFGLVSLILLIGFSLSSSSGLILERDRDGPNGTAVIESEEDEDEIGVATDGLLRKVYLSESRFAKVSPRNTGLSSSESSPASDLILSSASFESRRPIAASLSIFFEAVYRAAVASDRGIDPPRCSSSTSISEDDNDATTRRREEGPALCSFRDMAVAVVPTSWSEWTTWLFRGLRLFYCCANTWTLQLTRRESLLVEYTGTRRGAPEILPALVQAPKSCVLLHTPKRPMSADDRQACSIGGSLG